MSRCRQLARCRTASASSSGLVASLQELLERAALIKRHHHVGGLILFPETKHLDQRRMIELRQQLRLVDEAAQARDEGLDMLVRFDRDREIGLARRQRRWHVFLHRDVAAKQVVVRSIDHAEAAFADDADNFELGHARAVGQDIARVGGRDRGTRLRRARHGQLAIETGCRSRARCVSAASIRRSRRSRRKHRAVRIGATRRLGGIAGAGHGWRRQLSCDPLLAPIASRAGRFDSSARGANLPEHGPADKHR